MIATASDARVKILTEHDRVFKYGGSYEILLLSWTVSLEIN